MSEIINPVFTCPLSPPTQLFQMLIEEYKVKPAQAYCWLSEISEAELQRLLRIPTYRTAWVVTKRLLA